MAGAFEEAFHFQHAEQRFGHHAVAGDFHQGVAHDLRMHGIGLRALNRDGALGGAGDDAHLVRARLLDGGGDLAETIHDLGLDLRDHVLVAEMHFVDIDGAELVAPFVALGRDFFAHGLAHSVAVFEHRIERHIAQAADGGVADVRAERAARVSVLEEKGNRVADEHLIPDADAHGRALLGIHRLAAEIRLIQAQIQFVTFAEEVDDERGHSQFGGQENEAGFVQRGDDFAEQHIDFALAFVDNGVNAKRARERKRERHENGAGNKRDEERDEEGGDG